MQKRHEDVEAAELLTAFGGASKLERKTASLCAVAEDAEPAGLASARLPKGSAPIHPVAEHLPSASLTSTQEMLGDRPCTAVPIGGSMLHRQQSLGASILSWPAASAPLPLLSSTLRGGGLSGAFSPVVPSPREGLAAGAALASDSPLAGGGAAGAWELGPAAGPLGGPVGRGGGSVFVGPSRPRSAAARALLAGTMLHPVVQLGWQPLCEVHCNGLTGFFMGGHDRDLYIKCTAPEFANLPLVDAMQGGCMMTCSHFEKAAGRELSKKWKESIHVAGEGEGSKATLVAWLKRRAEADWGTRVVGKHVWVCWCADAEYYRAQVVSYNKDTGKHKVRYADQFTEELHLPVELLEWGPAKPAIAFDPSHTAFAPLLATQRAAELGGLAGLGARGRSRSAPAETLRSYAASYAASLLHQASVASSCCQGEAKEADEAPPGEGLGHRVREARTPELPPRAGAPTDASPPTLPKCRAVLLDEERFVLPPPPRRRRTGRGAASAGAATTTVADAPPAESAGAGTSCTMSEGSDGQAPRKRHRGVDPRGLAASIRADSAATEIWPPPPPPLSQLRAPAGCGLQDGSPRPLPTPLEQSAAPQWRFPLLGLDPAEPLSALHPDRFQVDLAFAAPPPAAGFSEANPSAICRWMGRTAMFLEENLLLRAAACRGDTVRDTPRHGGFSPGPAAAAAAWGEGRAAGADPGWGGCRGSPSARFQTLLVAARRHNCLAPHYEAMLERFEFFKADPERLRAKMEDFIWAALAEPHALSPKPRSSGIAAASGAAPLEILQ